MPQNILCVFGTRPEAIKMAPVLQALASAPGMRPILCVTGQHREMLDSALAAFGLTPDHDLAIMRPGQDLNAMMAAVLAGLGPLLARLRPDWLLVHGDTTTALAATLAGFHAGVPVGHVEAGLRSGDLARPWPEEMNRLLVDRLARLHFAPTADARDNLLREGLDPAGIEVTGNTVIDALRLAQARLAADGALRARIEAGWPSLDPARRLILVTAHRRESQGAPFAAICRALARLAARDDVELVYPLHLNPAVGDPARRLLGGLPRLHLLPPQDYPAFTHLLARADLVLTDSGGLQEEAPALGKPVLVMRAVTERPEAVAAGTVELVGLAEDDIVAAVGRVLEDASQAARSARAINPYGDGQAAARIVARLRREGSDPPA